MKGRILKDDARAISSARVSMARGFESKDVEFQQAEAERRVSAGAPLTPDQRAEQAARRTIELALARVRTELAQTTASARRQALAGAVRHLETQLGLDRDPH